MTPSRAAGFVLAALLLGSCGGGDSSTGAARDEEQASPSSSPAPAPSEPEADQIVGVTQGRYSPDPVILPAGEASTLALANNDPAAHNIVILKAKAARPLFKGRIVDPGERLVYKIPAMQPGRYAIRCDLHAGMRATAVVK